MKSKAAGGKLFFPPQVECQHAGILSKALMPCSSHVAGGISLAGLMRNALRANAENMEFQGLL